MITAIDVVDDEVYQLDTIFPGGEILEEVCGWADYFNNDVDEQKGNLIASIHEAFNELHSRNTLRSTKEMHELLSVAEVYKLDYDRLRFSFYEGYFLEEDFQEAMFYELDELEQSVLNEQAELENPCFGDAELLECRLHDLKSACLSS